MKPLHPKIGKQVLVLDDVKVSDDPAWKNGRVCLTVSRRAMEQLWTILNELQDVSEEVEPQESGSKHEAR